MFDPSKVPEGKEKLFWSSDGCSGHELSHTTQLEVVGDIAKALRPAKMLGYVRQVIHGTSPKGYDQDSANLPARFRSRRLPSFAVRLMLPFMPHCRTLAPATG